MAMTYSVWRDFYGNVPNRGESAALGRCISWANRLFSKSMKGNILNFSHEVEKMISVVFVQAYVVPARGV